MLTESDLQQSNGQVPIHANPTRMVAMVGLCRTNGSIKIS